MIIKQLVLSAIQKLITREQKINYEHGVYIPEQVEKTELEEDVVFEIKAPEYIDTAEYNEGIGYTNLN